MKGIVAILLFGVVATGAQQTYQCAHDFGFYPHDVACDQYWACDGGVATLKTCGNGLAFDDSDGEFLRENCDYYHNVNCSTRPERQPPISTSTNCPYQYGIFADTADCAVFWSCWGGEASRYQCGPGLAYSTETRVCTWIDQVVGCEAQRAAETNNIQCPASGELVPFGSFSRHAHDEDCRQFYVCLDGIPREYGCPIGTVFQIGLIDGNGECSDPKDVPGCEAYYGDLDLTAFKRSQLILGNIGGTANFPGTGTAIRRPQVDVVQQNRRQQASRQQSAPQDLALDAQPLK